jgi:hypothetical protein
MDFLTKMKGTTKSPPAVGLIEILWSWVGAFLGIAAVAIINDSVLRGADLVMIIALLINNIPTNRRYPEFWI